MIRVAPDLNSIKDQADMVAGSIHRSYQKDKADSVVYKKIIEKYIQDEWNFR